MTTYKDATFFVQIEPRWNRYYRTDDPKLDSIHAVAITQTKPNKPRSGVVVAKLTLRIPEAAFLPLRPEAVIVIPEDMVMVGPLEVEAQSPDE